MNQWWVMKRTMFIVSLAVLLTPGYALAVPDLMALSGSLSYSNGTAPNGTYQFTFRIYNVTSGGTPEWSEVKNVNVSSGLFSTYLGSVNPINLSFDENYYLGIEVESDGEMTPRQNLSSVAYSFRSDMSGGLACTDCLNETHIEDVYLSNQGDEMSGSLNVTGNVNATGTGFFQAIYQAGQALSSMYCSLTGCTMTGDLETQNLTVSGEANLSGIIHTNRTSGNVGIGTTVPDQKLEVAGIIHATSAIYTDSSSGFSATGAQINMYGSSYVATIADHGSAGEGFNFKNRGDSVLRILNGGNVGMGTTSPGAKLEINASGAALNIVNGSGSSKFWVNTTSGNVGIGTTAPSYPLHVNGFVNLNDDLKVESGWINNYAPLKMLDNMELVFGSGSDFGIRYDETTNDRFEMRDGYKGGNVIFTIKDQGTTSDFNFNEGQMFIDNSGNVGIGTTTPTGRLHVNSTDNTSFVINPATGYVGVGDVSPGNLLTVDGVGMMQLQANTTAMTCDSGNAGAIYYDGTQSRHYGCNGSVWNALY